MEVMDEIAQLYKYATKIGKDKDEELQQIIESITQATDGKLKSIISRVQNFEHTCRELFQDVGLTIKSLEVQNETLSNERKKLLEHLKNAARENDDLCHQITVMEKTICDNLVHINSLKKDVEQFTAAGQSMIDEQYKAQVAKVNATL